MEGNTAHADKMRSRRSTYKSISGGTLLICIGTILLLNTTGGISWSVWLDLMLLWPVLLISVGMRLIFVRTPLHWLCLTGPLMIAATTIWVAGSEPGSLWRWREDLTLNDAVAIACPSEDPSRPSRFDLGFEAGTLKLVSGHSDSAQRGFSGTMRWAGEEPQRGCGAAGNLRIGRSNWNSRVHIVSPFQDFGRQWDAQVASSGPVDMSLRIAAADADLDLRQFELTDLDLETAASSIVIHLGPPKGRVPVRIDGGVSLIELKVPEGTCFTVARDHRLGILDVADVRDEMREGRRRMRVTADACGETSGEDKPRYEISYEVPISSVSVNPEPAGA